jgi:predicted CXXCH cytochrome family protein
MNAMPPWDPNRRRALFQWLPSLVLLAVALAGGIALTSCSTGRETASLPPMIEGAEFVGNQACLDCHANYVRTFAVSAHGRFHSEKHRQAGMTGCESCHGPGSKHIASPKDKGRFILNPGKDPSSCLQCHTTVHAEFQMPAHHQVLEGRMNCVQCHDPHGRDIMKPVGGLATARLNESCGKCHIEQSRPVIYEHEALREGCVTCHQPHGSPNDKMLVQRDNNLCLRCHAETQLAGGDFNIGKVPHAALMRQGSCWSAGCHTAVHGSNVNARLLY